MTNRVFLFLFLLISNLALSQQTEDLIDNYSWVNAGIVDTEITCWAPGDYGYCGPLPAIGAFTPGGINFSYGLTDLYQSIDIQMALNAAGTGIIVTGFNFYFTAKNGNGWDDGRTDYLQAYVDFYNSGNQLLESYNYNLNYNFNWSNFNYTETFSDPYRLNQIETAVVGFVGRDNNYWAGFYGPEVYNIGFSLTYGIDPCIDDPLSSPSCPNFQEAILELQCASDPLSDINCPGYLEASLAIEDEIIEEEIIEEGNEEIIASNEDVDLEEEFLEEEEISEENIQDDLLEKEVADEDSSDTISPDLLKLVLSIIDTTEESIDPPLSTPALNVSRDNIINESSVDNKIFISEANQSETTKEVNEELAVPKEESSSDDMADIKEELVQEQNILDLSDSISDVSDQESISDNRVADKQDIQIQISAETSQTSFNKETDDSLILETLLLSSDLNEQEVSTSAVFEEQNMEEIFSEQETDLVLSPQLEMSNITTAVSSTGFANNNMQQLLAFGGNITEILNTPVPNFTRFEIKPPSQDEQIQTAKVENAAQNMTTEDIEAEALERIDSMDPSDQAIALQLIGYKAGFNSYGGTYQDVTFYNSKDMYTGNKVQNDRNIMLNLIGVDNKHQRMIEDQFK
jgi:hypothetical protein